MPNGGLSEGISHPPAKRIRRWTTTTDLVVQFSAELRRVRQMFFEPVNGHGLKIAIKKQGTQYNNVEKTNLLNFSRLIEETVSLLFWIVVILGFQALPSTVVCIGFSALMLVLGIRFRPFQRLAAAYCVAIVAMGWTLYQLQGRQIENHQIAQDIRIVVIVDWTQNYSTQLVWQRDEPCRRPEMGDDSSSKALPWLPKCR